MLFWFHFCRHAIECATLENSQVAIKHVVKALEQQQPVNSTKIMQIKSLCYRSKIILWICCSNFQQKDQLISKHVLVKKLLLCCQKYPWLGELTNSEADDIISTLEGIGLLSCSKRKTKDGVTKVCSLFKREDFYSAIEDMPMIRDIVV